MTRRLTHIILTAGLSTLLGAVNLSAQGQREVAEIPFAFHANHKLMPAGKYVVEQKNEIGIFQLRDSAGEAIFVSMIQQDRGKADNPKLTFRCYGNDRVLAQVWTEDGRGYGVSESSIEKDLHRRLDMAALISVRLTPR